MARNYLQGKYTPRNPQKYIGDITTIRYRSSWEKKFMLWCDNNPGILKWNSEQIVIPYVKPETGKIHRYFVDFIIQYKTRSGEIKTSLVEIKPKTQTQAPVKGKKRNKTYINEVITYTTNQAKWKAATKYAMERGMDFKVITEEHLFGK